MERAQAILDSHRRQREVQRRLQAQYLAEAREAQLLASIDPLFGVIFGVGGLSGDDEKVRFIGLVIGISILTPTVTEQKSNNILP